MMYAAYAYGFDAPRATPTVAPALTPGGYATAPGTPTGEAPLLTGPAWAYATGAYLPTGAYAAGFEGAAGVVVGADAEAGPVAVAVDAAGYILGTWVPAATPAGVAPGGGYYTPDAYAVAVEAAGALPLPLTPAALAAAGWYEV